MNAAVGHGETGSAFICRPTKLTKSKKKRKKDKLPGRSFFNWSSVLDEESLKVWQHLLAGFNSPFNAVPNPLMNVVQNNLND